MRMCANHPETQAAAYCRECGKPLCGLCRMDQAGAVFCADHAAPYSAPAATQAAPPPPYTPPAPYPTPSPYAASSPYTDPLANSQGSPALALILGTIPGVGAIYNGQYAKGLIHAVIFGLLITIVSQGGENGVLAPLIGILIGVWWFYMLLEAYHTARKRHLGIPVDEFSSLVNLHGARSGAPAGAVILIGLGGLLLLQTSGLISMERILRFWPLALIGVGIYMLYARSSQGNDVNAPHNTAAPMPPQEFRDEAR